MLNHLILHLNNYDLHLLSVCLAFIFRSYVFHLMLFRHPPINLFRCVLALHYVKSTAVSQSSALSSARASQAGAPRALLHKTLTARCIACSKHISYIYGSPLLSKTAYVLCETK